MVRLSIDIPMMKVTIYSQMSMHTLQKKFDEKSQALNFQPDEKEQLLKDIQSFVLYGFSYSTGLKPWNFTKKFKNRTKDVPEFVDDSNNRINELFTKRGLPLTEFSVRDFMAVAVCLQLKNVGQEMKMNLTPRDLKV